MEYFSRINTILLFSALFLIVSKSTHAAPQPATSNVDRPACGDYTILKNPVDRDIFEKNCGINNSENLELLNELVSRLNPVDEAQASARRGDFRLAVTTGGGPPNPERKNRWYLQGVKCQNINDENVFIWIRLSDALTRPRSIYQGSMIEFAKKYNLTIISEEDFPRSLNCSLK